MTALTLPLARELRQVDAVRLMRRNKSTVCIDVGTNVDTEDETRDSATTFNFNLFVLLEIMAAPVVWIHNIQTVSCLP
jgi:hypothetical protein